MRAGKTAQTSIITHMHHYNVNTQALAFCSLLPLLKMYKDKAKCTTVKMKVLH